MKKWFNALLVLMFVLTLFLAGCGQSSSGTSSADADNEGEATQDEGNKGDVTLTIATVNNPDMETMESLSSHFEEETGISLEFVVLPENDLRQKVTEDVALGAGQFDIVTIGTYDAPIWAQNGWIENLSSYFDEMPADEKEKYDLDDVFQSLRDALSYEDNLYALPFYGESSMLYYNKEMLEAANVEMPDNPTWDEVAEIAKKTQEANDKPGIVLRGLPGWGEILAPLNTVINAFGGSWYDMEWNAQLDSPETVEAVQFYVDLLAEAGQSGATTTGFTEALTLMANGEAAMWYDSTVAAGFLNDPESSQVVGKIGYAAAPSQKKDNNGWLWAWSLGIEAASKHKEEAFQFITWATSKEYINLVGEEKGWVVAPPGTRQSTYDNPNYQEAAPFADIVLNTMNNVNYTEPAIDPVPYVGVQYVGIPEFQQLGTEVSQQIAEAIAGGQSVDEAMKKSQELAEQVAIEGGYK